MPRYSAKIVNADGQPDESPDPISNYLETIPSSTTLVYQGKPYLYNHPGDEALYASTYTYLDRVENIQIVHWSNSTAASQTYSESYTTQLKVTEGEELSTSVGLDATFLGLSVGTSTDKKTFTETETTSSQTYTLTVTVPPNSDVWFYQRKYVFRTQMTWVLDAWGELWNVGSKGAYHIQEGEVVSEIYAKDYVTTSQALEGQSKLEFETLAYENFKSDTTRKWENTTELCKSTLEDIGIDGSQQ